MTVGCQTEASQADVGREVMAALHAVHVGINMDGVLPASILAVLAV